jgi:hypothetical protein
MTYPYQFKFNKSILITTFLFILAGLMALFYVQSGAAQNVGPDV